MTIFYDYVLTVLAIAGEYRDESEAWYLAVTVPGVELLEGPNADAPRMLEMYLTGKVLHFILSRLYPLHCCILIVLLCADGRTMPIRTGTRCGFRWQRATCQTLRSLSYAHLFLSMYLFFVTVRHRHGP